MKKITLSIMMGTMLLFASGASAQTNDYVIVTSISDTNDSYYEAVKALKNYRNAEVVTFNPSNVGALQFSLSGLAPRYVAVIVKPIEIHINFVREFLMMSTLLDMDPFSDFSYGYITGATGQDALNFVNRIILAESQNIQNLPLSWGGYAASSINMVYTYPGGWMEDLNPVSYAEIYLETSDSATGLNYFLANSNHLLNKKILDIGHNGDPHMLWLFEGGNMSPNPPSWLYDSTKIEDPAYARVGLSSAHIGALNLYPAVAFNGACHAGETKKVMVEGDIEATFGDTEGIVRFYTMSDTFSFALSILKTGITGYFAPCGANNANDQGEEVYNAFLFQEPLGDIHKRTVDGVVMGCLGNRPNLRIYVPGSSTWDDDINPSGNFDPDDWSGAKYMLGGKANRIYFGDPMFNPFANNHSDSLDIAKATLDSVNNTTLDINLNFNKPDGYYPVWDKFHFSDTRIYIPVELPEYVGEVTGFYVIDSSAPYQMVIHALERFDGKYILHIEVDIPDDMYDPINYFIKFRIHFLNTGIDDPLLSAGKLNAYPNPASTHITIPFTNNDGLKHSILIYDSKGSMVLQLDDITGDKATVSLQGLESGLYSFRLLHTKGMAGWGKFVIE